MRPLIPTRTRTSRTTSTRNSLQVIPAAYLEPSLENVNPGDHFQFQRLGYFNVDDDSRPGSLVFNRTVALRDSWARMEQKK